MGVYLSEGALKRMSRDNFCGEEMLKMKTVLQVSDYRYRLLLSDGSHHMFGALSKMKNDLIHSGRLQQGSVVMLTKFRVTEIACGKPKLILVHDLDVMVDKFDLIGEPLPAPNTLTWPLIDQSADAITASMKGLSLDLTLTL